MKVRPRVSFCVISYGLVHQVLLVLELHISLVSLFRNSIDTCFIRREAFDSFQSSVLLEINRSRLSFLFNQ